MSHKHLGSFQQLAKLGYARWWGTSIQVLCSESRNSPTSTDQAEASISSPHLCWCQSPPKKSNMGVRCRMEATQSNSRTSLCHSHQLSMPSLNKRFDYHFLVLFFKMKLGAAPRHMISLFSPLSSASGFRFRKLSYPVPLFEKPWP